jgi:hypothetical protein
VLNKKYKGIAIFNEDIKKKGWKAIKIITT